MIAALLLCSAILGQGAGLAPDREAVLKFSVVEPVARPFHAIAAQRFYVGWAPPTIPTD